MGVYEAVSGLIKQIAKVEKDVSDLKRLQVNAPFNAGKASQQTIAAGAISVTRPLVLVQPQTGIADDLDTINNFSDGKFIVISTADVGDTITVRDESISGGNIALRGVTSRVLSDPEDSLLLIYKESVGFWIQAGGIPGGGSPGLHATTHQHGGTDEVATATPANNAIPKAGGTGKLANGWLDATLESLAALGTVADRIAYTTGVDTWAETPLTAFARTILDDANQAAVQATLALVPGTNVQAQDAELQAIADLVSAADRLPYFTGGGTASLATFTAYGRTLAALADAAAHAIVLGTAIDGTADLGAPADTDKIAAVRAGSLGTLLWSALKTALNGLYVALTGNQTITGTKTFGDGSVAASIAINGAAGTQRAISLMTNGVLRWRIVCSADAESGSDAGSDLEIYNYTDAGANISTPFRIKRSNGFFTIGPLAGITPSAPLHVLNPTLGNVIFRLQTASTANDPTLLVAQNRVATTNATPATLHTFAIAASNTYIITVKVIARRTGGAAGTADDGAAYYIQAGYTTKAGVVTLLGGSVMERIEREDVAAYDCQLVISGTDVLVQVTGVANTNITWHLPWFEFSSVGT